MSPNLTKDLAAQMTTPRLPVREKPLTCRDDGHSNATLNTGQLTGASVDTVTRSRDALDPLDDRSTTFAVTKHQLQLAAMAIL
jgi:hypothetical protein